MRRRRGEDGFTLVELLVVVTVLGVLLAIAVPTFAAAGGRAGKRAAEVDLHTAANAALLLAAEAGGAFVDDGAPISPEDLHDEEPSLAFADTPSGDVIGVEVDGDETTMHLTKFDRNGQLVVLILEAGRRVGANDDESSSDDGGNGQSSGHRRDGDTPASGNRSSNQR